MSKLDFRYEVKRLTQTPRGVLCGESRSKYSDELVAKVRNEYKRGKFGIRKLSKKFGVPQRTIRDWVKGRRRNIKLTKTVHIKVRVHNE